MVKRAFPVTDMFLTSWIKSPSKLYVIELKPMARTRVEMHSLIYLKRLFRGTFAIALIYSSIIELETHEAAKRKTT